MDDDRARDVVRARNVDFQLQIAVLAARFAAQCRAGIIRDAQEVQIERVIQAMVIVFHRDRAVDAVPLPGKMSLDGFGNVRGAVRQHDDSALEILDSEGTREERSRSQSKRTAHAAATRSVFH